MRKLLALAGVLVIALPLAACGGDNKPSGTETRAAIVLDDTDRPLSSGSDYVSGSGSPASGQPGEAGTTAAGTAAVPGTTVPGSSPTAMAAGTGPTSTGAGTATRPAATSAPNSPAASPAATSPSTSPAPSGTAALVLTSAVGNRNQEVEVVLSASAMSGSALRGWIIDVEYVPASAEAASCTVTGFAVCNEAYRPNLVRFVGTADAAVSEIGRAKFKLIGAAGTSSTLRIVSTECIGASGEDVPCTGAEATLRIN